MAEPRVLATGKPYVEAEPFIRPVLQVVVGTAVAATLLPHIRSQYWWLVLLTVLLAIWAVFVGGWSLLLDRCCIAVDSRGVWFRGRHFVPWQEIRQVRSIRWSTERRHHAAVLIALAPIHAGAPYTASRAVLQALAVEHLFPGSLVAPERDSWDPGPLERVLRAALLDEHFRARLGIWTPPRFSGLAARVESMLESLRLP